MIHTLVVPMLALWLAQPPEPGRPSGEAFERMKLLEFLVGDWRGEAWAEFRPGDRRTLKQTEKVSRKLGGRVLLIEGLGTHSASQQDRAHPAHEALAVVNWDERQQGFIIRAFTARGDYTETKAEVGEKSLVWGFDRAGHKIRFTVRINDAGQWHEVGEASEDGTTWRKFLEMTLSRSD